MQWQHTGRAYSTIIQEHDTTSSEHHPASGIQLASYSLQPAAYINSTQQHQTPCSIYQQHTSAAYNNTMRRLTLKRRREIDTCRWSRRLRLAAHPPEVRTQHRMARAQDARARSVPGRQLQT
eukprot:2793829-Rhodomonas_salina.1